MLSNYFDLVISPITNLTYTYSGLYCSEHEFWLSSFYTYTYEKNTDALTIKAELSDEYTIKRKFSKKYSLSFPNKGPFAPTDGGLSTGEIVGNVIAVLVAVGVAGFCIYYFVVKRRNYNVGNDAHLVKMIVLMHHLNNCSSTFQVYMIKIYSNIRR